MLPITIATAITNCLQNSMTKANIRIFLSLVVSFLCVRYEITTRGLSRYCSYSLRHIFRFLSKPQDWLKIRVHLFKTFFYSSVNVYLVAVDEVVEGKSGKHTFGLGKYYSSCAQKSIKGVCFFALSLINVSTKTSHLLDILQVIYNEEDKQRIAENKEKIKAGKARTKAGKNLPKGRKTNASKAIEGVLAPKENLTASFRVFKKLFSGVLILLKDLMPEIKISYLVADSAYSGIDYLKTAAIYGCKLISKLKSCAVLYLPAKKIQGKRGAVGTFGEKVDLNNICADFLKKTLKEDGKTHQYYQFLAYNKAITGVLLNIVVIITTDEKGRKCTNIWLTNDENLSYEILLEYYSMRFQIEYHFRDAKQHCGLADFKNYKEANLTNFVNLSFTMGLVASIILQQYRVSFEKPKLSILDLKIIFNAHFTAKKVIKLLRLDDRNNFYSNIIDKFMPTDTINRI